MFEHMDYNPQTGNITNSKTGKQIGYKNGKYLMIAYKGKRYYAHRVAWYLTYGAFPPAGLFIDHINRIGSDNRLSNLRLATHTINAHNRNQNGCGYHSKHKCWQAYIRVNNKLIHLGYYATREQARLAYLNAKTIYHPTAPVIA